MNRLEINPYFFSSHSYILILVMLSFYIVNVCNMPIILLSLIVFFAYMLSVVISTQQNQSLQF